MSEQITCALCGEIHSKDITCSVYRKAPVNIVGKARAVLKRVKELEDRAVMYESLTRKKG